MPSRLHPLAALALVSFCATSCDENMPSGDVGEEGLLLSVIVMPADNSSAYDGDLEVTVEMFDVQVRTQNEAEMAARMDSLKDALHLVTYPGLKPVGATTSVEPPRSCGDTYCAPGVVRIVPQEPLSPQAWYVLVLSSVPQGLEPSPYFWTRIGSSYVSRFTTGSAPRLTTIEVCPSESGSETDTQFTFSEPILSAGPVSSALTFQENDAATSCDDDFTITEATEAFILHCSPRFTTSARLTVSILPDQFTSQTGAAVPPGSYTLKLDGLPADSGCRVFTAPP
jgi:hypothetical protein